MKNNTNQNNLFIEYNEDDIQEFAESNFERRLTQDELNELKERLFDSEVLDLRIQILQYLINCAIKKYEENKTK